MPHLPKPSPSMFVSLIALFVALGGTSYAAVTLATHSVTGSKIAPNAVTLSKIKTHAVSQSKLRPGAVSPSKLSPSVKKSLAAGGPTGPTGAAGPTGAQGSQGTALAYGTFTADGGVRAGSASNLTGLQVSNPAAGVYCLSGLTATVKNVSATLDATGAAAGATVAATTHDAPSCPASTQVEVDTFGPAAAPANQSFAVTLN